MISKGSRRESNHFSLGRKTTDAPPPIKPSSTGASEEEWSSIKEQIMETKA